MYWNTYTKELTSNIFMYDVDLHVYMYSCDVMVSNKVIQEYGQMMTQLTVEPIRHVDGM